MVFMVSMVSLFRFDELGSRARSTSRFSRSSSSLWTRNRRRDRRWYGYARPRLRLGRLRSLAFPFSRKASILRFAYDAKVLGSVVSRVSILVVDVFAVSLSRLTGFDHFCPSRIPLSPAFLLPRLSMVAVVFLSVITRLPGRALLSLNRCTWRSFSLSDWHVLSIPRAHIVDNRM